MNEFLADIRERTRQLQEHNKAWTCEFSNLMTYQNLGMTEEKNGNLLDAENAYIECVEYGEHSELMKIHNYAYSIERLAIIYRKQKRYTDEVNILKVAFKHKDFTSAKLGNRLKKAIELELKTKSM